jgi:RNA polymerase subunit RPABC4/transcription elongation factor Spt4
MLSDDNKTGNVNPSGSTILCPKCGATVAAQKFCSACGAPFKTDGANCVKCGHDIEKGAKFCPECGSAQVIEIKCAGCGRSLDSGMKFCPECGTARN